MTIDTETWPPNALLVRGQATAELVAGVPPEYLEASRKVVPAEWEGFEDGVRALYKETTRIVVTPHWAKVLDFVTRLPSPVEKLIRQTSARDA
ncbi:MAG TPA: hypothetical protein VMF65_10140 [Acidimicrobiales bacterium]|nr:hypothetical protein [Acidimicrobiales bacterium]